MRTDVRSCSSGMHAEPLRRACVVFALLIDARFIEPETELGCDLCIVGAGPAGIAIADALRESGLTIVLLESGGFEPELFSQNLTRGESIGQKYFALDACRFRLFGGGTNRWGGWCRPLEALDFERRDWVPWSDWPISQSAIEPYYKTAAKLFELTNSCFDLPAWQARLPPPFALDDTNFENVIFQYSPPTNFGEAYRARLLAAPNVTTLLHANLTDIELDADSNRIGRLRIAAAAGTRFNIRPRAVVLAAGGIENARLLLASQTDRAAGLGNDYDTVGRFFMEHLHVPAGHVIAAPDANRAFYEHRSYDGVKIRGVITPTVAAQYRQRLLATSIAVEPASYSIGHPFLSWPAQLKIGPGKLFCRLRDGRYGDVLRAVKRNSERVATIPMRLQTLQSARRARDRAPNDRDGNVFSLYFRAEQAPDPESRVTLSDQRDAFGGRQIRLDWRPKHVDLDSIRRWLELLEADFRARGIGEVIAPAADWESRLEGGLHHMGTTRMSADPRRGVVDADCRVHSVANLYIAGSSVFSTGGYANPTFTLVALALRLAETLRNRLQTPYSLVSKGESARSNR